MRVITFGEIMGRLSTKRNLRIHQACPGCFDFTFAGAEANVAASISLLGGQSTFVTALPDNAVADSCIANIRSLGVDTRFMLKFKKGRLGLFYLETGANQRPSNVIYDRDNSSVSLTTSGGYPWAEIFRDGNWFHISGITPAISRNAADSAMVAVKLAKDMGLNVSLDLNFRKKLWQWDNSLSPRNLARKTIEQMLPFVNLVIGNEEDASDVLDISAGRSNVASGNLEIDRYPDVAKQIMSHFPTVTKVAITLRQSISATHNNWGAMLYDNDLKQAFFAPLTDGKYDPYQIRNIVDRVGAGDSFAAALIFALNTPELATPGVAISFAAAASCLAHSIQGDFNFSSRQEVESLMKGSASGRVIR